MPNAPLTNTAKVNSKLGINLEGIAYYDRGRMFADTMKQSGANVQFNTDATSGYDSQGWPLFDCSVYIDYDSGPGATETTAPYLIPGVYKLDFQGQATLSAPHDDTIIFSNQIYYPLTNITTADVTVPPQHVGGLVIHFSNTINGVKNYHLFYPGEQGKIFSDEFMNAIAPFQTIRLMDVLETNDNTIVNWSDRPVMNGPTQANDNGMALEYAILLANITGKDIWVNVPANASDDYITKMAQMFKDNLRPDVHLYVEYSNEVWNTLFQQTKDLWATGTALAEAGDTTLTLGETCSSADFALNDSGQWQTVPNCSKYLVGVTRYMQQSVHIANIYASIFGQNAINNTVRVVISWNFNNPYWITKYGLDQYMVNYVGPPKNYFYGLAGAPYLGYDGSANINNLNSIDSIDASLTTQFNTNTVFGLGNYAGPYTGVLNQPYQTNFDAFTMQSVARYYGLKSLAYEFGLAVAPNPNYAAVDAYDESPQAGAQTAKLLHAFLDEGNDLGMYFTLSGHEDSGNWGATNDVSNLNKTKYQAIMSIH